MSIWSTFKVIKVCDADTHSEAKSSDCGCSGNDEVRLSKAWNGFPLRLCIAGEIDHAHAALDRNAAREIGNALIKWANDDERQSG